MNNEEILKSAIEKAIKNGYDKTIAENMIELIPEVFSYKDYLPREVFIRGFLFSHSFAKAFWSCKCDCKPIIASNGQTTHEVSPKICAFIKKEWQYHLQQMVLSENPIIYLKKFT